MRAGTAELCDQENKAGISHIWEGQEAEKRGGLLDFPFYSVSNASPCMVLIFRVDLLPQCLEVCFLGESESSQVDS